MSGNQSPDEMTPDQLRELANSEISDGEREALEALRMKVYLFKLNVSQ